MDLTLLHKKLQPNWSAGTVSKSLSTQASLNSIQLSFDKLEMKIKMRVLLSLLNFDVKSKADCMTSIRELLKLAADESKHGKVIKHNLCDCLLSSGRVYPQLNLRRCSS